jgi:hypothetical protein
LVLGFNSLVAVACLVSAVTILYANNRLGSRRLVDISAAVPDDVSTTSLVPSAPVTATDGSIVADTTEPSSSLRATPGSASTRTRPTPTRTSAAAPTSANGPTPS